MRTFLLAILLFSTLAVSPSLATAAEADANLYREPKTGLEFIRIPGGTFSMGDTVHRGYDFEQPLHPVTVKEFFIGRHEVTFAAYDQFAKATGQLLPDDAGWGRGNRPVINVSWEDAKAFAAWLSKQSGRSFRLPTEAEWEYAARGGTGSAFWWGNQAGKGNANCNGCGSPWDNSMTAPVGSFAANPFGLYDVHGNVYEWVEDRRHDSYQGAPGDGSAWLEGTSPDRVQRSGSYRDYPEDIKASTRNWTSPARRLIDCGFRLVMEP